MSDPNIEQKTQTLRSLEALALKPGTPEEGELAKERAIELSNKYGIPSIFTQKDYVPPTPEPKPFKPAAPTQPQKLHRAVVAMEETLGQHGWKYRNFYGGSRIYQNAQRPNEEIQMSAHWFGEFSCMHLYRPASSLRPAGSDATELAHFFNSVAYRYELWPKPQYARRPRYDDFCDPLLDEFDPNPTPMPGSPPAKPQEPLKEEKAPEKPVIVEPPPPPPPTPQELRLDMVDEMVDEARRKEIEIRDLLSKGLMK